MEAGWIMARWSVSMSTGPATTQTLSTGFSSRKPTAIFIPSNTCGPGSPMILAWTSEKSPSHFSMHSSMCGALGIGIDLNRASDEKLQEIAGYIADYKKIRNTVQFGDLYRLSSLKNCAPAGGSVRSRRPVRPLPLPGSRALRRDLAHRQASRPERKRCL